MGFSKGSKVISCPIPTGLPWQLDPKCLWLLQKTTSITEIRRMAQQKLQENKQSWAQFQAYFYSTFQSPSATTTLGRVGTLTKFSTRKPLGNNISHKNHGKKHLVTLHSSAILKAKGNTAVNQSTRTTSLKNHSSAHVYFSFSSPRAALWCFVKQTQSRGSPAFMTGKNELTMQHIWLVF